MTQATESPGILVSIGYGDRPWDDFLHRLKLHHVEFLVDVRSHPQSRQPEFNEGSLCALLARNRIRYLFMGDTLGGRPEDPDCYIDGRVDYARCEEREQFKDSVARLTVALTRGHRVALMCSELDPERCHRSKLIGEALRKRNVSLRHIDRDGSLASQEEVIARITGGQSELFGTAFSSRARYPSQPVSEGP